MIKRYFNRSLIYLLLTAVLASCAGTGTSSLSIINLEVGKDESVAFFVRKKKYMASLGLVKVVMDGWPRSWKTWYWWNGKSKG